MRNIRVLICTRGNSAYLHDLVSSLQVQIKPYHRNVRIGIATNQSELNPLLDDIDVRLSAPLGYASTRTEALKLRIPGEGIIFLDDDNKVPTDWLSNLIKMIEQFPTYILKGRVNFIDENLLRIPFLADGLKTNTEVQFAATPNIYFPSEVVDSETFTFNLDFDSGGEDTELTFRLHKNGYKILVVDEFPAFEIVSQEKMNPDYLRERLQNSRDIFDRVIALHGSRLQKFKRLALRSVRTLFFKD